MPLKLRRPASAPGSAKTALTAPSSPAIGRSAVSTISAAARKSALVLVDDRHRSDDALGSRGNPERGQGAVSEELGRLEGVGEAGGAAPRQRPRRATNGALRPKEY